MPRRSPLRARAVVSAGLVLCLVSAAAWLPPAALSAPPAAAAQAESHLVRAVRLKANDLVYSAATGSLYASVPSAAGAGGNSVTSVDPQTLAVGAPVFVGSEPRELGLSDDGQVMYVELEGSATVRRFDVQTATPGIQFGVGREDHGGPSNFVHDFAVVPGAPESVVVARRRRSSPSTAGVTVFDNGVARPNSISSFFGISSLAFATPTKLYGGGGTGALLNLDAAGVTNSPAPINNIFVGSSVKFAAGRLYTGRGQIINPDTGTLVGTFQTPGTSNPLDFVIDAAAGRAYYITDNSFGGTNHPVTITAFDLNTFVPVGSLTVEGVNGTAASLVRWGANGLAFRSGADQVFVIQTTLVPSAEPVPPSPAPTPLFTPTPTPTPLPATIRQVALPNNDFVYNPATQAFHVSVPSSAASGGNSVVTFDPQTLAVGAPVFVGSEPNRLALSDTGQTLHVGLDGAGAVRRLDVATQTAGPQFSFGVSIDGPRFAADIEAVPGSETSIAAALGTFGGASVVIYDDGVARPNTAGVGFSTDIKFNPAGTKLYTTRQRVAVGAAGATFEAGLTNSAPLGLVDLHNGLLYSSPGTVVDPETDELKGTFTGFSFTNGTPGIVVDPAHNRAFFLVNQNSQNYVLAYDLTTLLPVGFVHIPNLNVFPGKLVRWGANGLAFRTASSVVLVQSTLVDPSAPVPDPTPTPTPTPIPTPTPVTPTFVRQVGLPINDIAFHAPSQTVYASVPSAAGAPRGNTITPVNPATGELGASVFVGSEPRLLAGADGVIYAHLSGAQAVRRFDVATQSAGLQFPVPGFTLPDMEVMPGHPQTIAISDSSGGVRVYDDGVPRPNTNLFRGSVGPLEFSSDPGVLYGYNNHHTGFEFSRMRVDAEGVTITRDEEMFGGFNANIEFAGGRVYVNTGRVIDPETFTLLGTFREPGTFTAVAVDQTLNRVFFAAEDNNSGGIALRAYDLTTFLPVGSVTIPFRGTPTRLYRWGTNGLALRAFIDSTTSRLYLIQSALVSNAAPVPTGVQFASETGFTSEGNGFANVMVLRTGSLEGTTTVEYATADGTGNDRRHYTAARGTLTFAPGESSKTFPVLLTENAFVEGDKTVTLTLSNATGAELTGPAASLLTIHDNDFTPTTANPSDTPQQFVRQHYHDFLGRQGDPGGIAFWTGNITSCGADLQCREARRVNVSAAFFLSIEYQETGYLVYRMHKAAYGDLPGKPVPVRRDEFLPDTQAIGQGVQVGIGDWQQRLEANKRAYADGFVARPRFADAHPPTLTPAQFVDRLNANTGGALSQSERDHLVDALGSNSMTRAEVLRAVAEDETLRQSELRKAFVLTQYFGYLRRDPDALPDTNFDGWQFWLDKLNQFDGDFVQAEMVRAFIISIEYRQRFGQ